MRVSAAATWITLLVSASNLPAQEHPPLQLPQFDASKMEPGLAEVLETARARTLAALQSHDLTAAEHAALIGQLGQVYRAFDLFDAAADCYEMAAELAPEVPRWTYLQATLHLEMGRVDEAASMLASLVEREPDTLPVVVYLGEARLSQGRLDEAGRLFERARETEGGSAIGHFGLGRVYAESGESSKAIEHFRAALELQPDATAIHYPLARQLLRLGRRNEAERHLALRGDEKVEFPDTVSKEIGDIKALVAFEVVQGMAASETDSPEQVLRFALSYIGDLKGTVEAFEDVLETREPQDATAPQRAVLHYVTGGIAVRQGLDDEAREHFARAVELEPDLVPARIQLGNLLALEGDLEAAIEQFSAALKQRAGDRDLLMKRGTAYLNAGRLEAAIGDLERVLESDPANVQAGIRLAQAYEAGGRPGRADAHLQRMLESDRDPGLRANVLRAWAEILRRRNDFDGAIRRLTASVEANPSDLPARMERARLLGHVGRLAAAAEEFGNVLAQRPDHQPAVQGRVTALILLGRYRGAAELLTEAVDANGEPLALATILIRIHAAAPDPTARDPEAALALAAALEHVAEESPWIADSVAMAHASAGEFVDAARWQERAAALPGAAERLELYRSHRAYVAPTGEELLLPLRESVE